MNLLISTIRLSFLSLFCCSAAFAITTFKALTLQNRTAGTIEQMVKPVLPEDCRVSGQEYQLIVQCASSDLNQIVSLVKQLDVPQENLVIRFKQIHNADYNAREEYGKVKVYSTQSDSNQSQDRTIQVQNGNEANIGLGDSFPYRDFFGSLFDAQSKFAFSGLFSHGSGQSSATGGSYGSETHYKDVLNRFTVLPQLHGNKVKLTFSWQFDHQDKIDAAWERQHGTIHQSQTSTVIDVPLGEWTPLAQYGTSSETQPNARVYDTREISNPKTNLLIRVDRSTPAVDPRRAYPE